MSSYVGFIASTVVTRDGSKRYISNTSFSSFINSIRKMESDVRFQEDRLLTSPFLLKPPLRIDERIEAEQTLLVLRIPPIERATALPLYTGEAS